MMYPGQSSNWLDFDHELLIFLILGSIYAQ